MHPITILLVDDHRLIRESWTELLNSDPRLSVMGTASTAEQAIDIATREKPQVVLMDINMHPVNGFDATKAIRKFSPGSKIIGVSMHAMPVYAKKILQLGARGYVTKNSSTEELINAILEVAKGKKYICEEVRDSLLQDESSLPRTGPNINLLSKREIEIARLIKDAFTSKEIASTLGINIKTVEVHRYNLLKKLQLKNAASLVNFINENGL